MRAFLQTNLMLLLLFCGNPASDANASPAWFFKKSVYRKETNREVRQEVSGWIRGGKLRVETFEDGSKVSILVDAKEKRRWIVVPEKKKYYSMGWFSGLVDKKGASIFKKPYKTVGKDIKAGNFTCDHLSLSGAGQTFDACFSRSGLFQTDWLAREAYRSYSLGSTSLAWEKFRSVVAGATPIFERTYLGKDLVAESTLLELKKVEVSDDIFDLPQGFTEITPKKK